MGNLSLKKEAEKEIKAPTSATHTAELEVATHVPSQFSPKASGRGDTGETASGGFTFLRGECPCAGVCGSASRQEAPLQH